MIRYKNVILRPMCESDIIDNEQWNTTETEWMNWDAPWEEDEPFDVEEERRNLHKAISNPPKVYGGLELDTDEGRHIGSVSRYFDCGDKNAVCVGIDIPPVDARNKGYGKNALILWMAYIFENMDIEEIYTQTWSGNYPMVKLAEKIGFEEIGRVRGMRKVRGERYDSLTFRIERERFLELYGDDFANLALIGVLTVAEP